MAKRPDGALEHEIMRVLWSADRPLKPAEINGQLAAPLAYTTVATVLTRLQAKGLVDRSAADRGFAYSPVHVEADLAVQRMREVLASTRDPEVVLLGFLGGLSRRDRKALRKMLAEDEA